MYASSWQIHFPRAASGRIDVFFESVPYVAIGDVLEKSADDSAICKP